MKITQITVSYGRTQSLPEYSNVKPQLTIGAELEEGDEAEAVRAALLAEARAFVEAAIDDALEGAEQAPKFSTEPRFCLWASRISGWGISTDRPQIIVLAPEGTKYDEFDFISLNYKRGYRYPAARQYAEQEAGERRATLIDCADGDLSKIPDEYRKVVEKPAVPRQVEEPVSVGYDPDDDDDFGEDDER